MHREMLAAALTLFASIASAQSVYKCVDESGTAVYQSRQCGEGQEAEDTWSAVPASPQQIAEADRRSRQRRAGAEYLHRLANRQRRSVRVQIPLRSSDEDECDKARSRRERMFRSGRRLDYEARAKLDNAVMQACY